MAVTTSNTLSLSDVCLEIYGSSSTSGRSLSLCHIDATGTFDGTYTVAGNTLLDFRGYTHSSISPVVQTGLVLHLDAANYSGSGVTWGDLSGNNNDFTWNTVPTWNSSGWFDISDTHTLSFNGNLSPTTTGTLVFWIKTTDTQALFLDSSSSTSGGNYVGAFRSGNKEYYSGSGTPIYNQDTMDKPNIYDNLRDGNWHMVEFKNVNLSSWTYHQFNGYNSYTFGTGTQIGKIMYYSHSLTAQESLDNFNADKDRYGASNLLTPEPTPSYMNTNISDYKTRVQTDGGSLVDEPWFGDEFFKITSTQFDSYFNYIYSSSGGFSGTFNKIYALDSTNTNTYDETVTTPYSVTTSLGRPGFVCGRNTDLFFGGGGNSKSGNLYIVRMDLDYNTKSNYVTFAESASPFEYIEVGINSSGHLYAKEDSQTAVTWTGATASDFDNCKLALYKNGTTYDIYLNGVKRLTGTCRDVNYRWFHSRNPNNPSPSSTAFVGTVYSCMGFLADIPAADIANMTTPH